MGCRTRIIYHEWFARRGFTSLRAPVNRYRLFLSALCGSPLSDTCPRLEAPAASENEILQVHVPDYMDRVQEMDLTGEGKLDGSTPAWQGMYARAERVVGGTIHAADLLASGAADHVFNPAGGQHHAHADRGGGFCVFNDVVAAVRRLQERGLQRVAVLDIDGHHGDGTESLLYGDQALAISLHQFGGRTYPGTGSADAVGEGDGAGFTMNVPLEPGTGDAAYLEILDGTVEPLLRSYSPQVIILEFGTDGLAVDPLLKLNLSVSAYQAIAGKIHRLAHELCDGRLLVVGGGGYAPNYVVRSWLLMLGELSGVLPCTVHPDARAWLAERPAHGDSRADAQSLAASAAACRAIYPLHGIPLDAPARAETVPALYRSYDPAGARENASG